MTQRTTPEPTAPELVEPTAISLGDAFRRTLEVSALLKNRTRNKRTLNAKIN